MNAPLLKTTALLPVHEKLKARLVEFGGWRMPVQYTGIAEEHRAVREACGLFDISHMGEFWASGPGAMAYLDSVLTNDVSALEVGKGQYTILPNDDGGVIDDLLVYRVESERFLLIVNAAKIDEDWAWMSGKAQGNADVQLVNRSSEMSAVALQGPKAVEVAKKFLGAMWAEKLPSRNGIVEVSWNCQTVWVARTGYTGEDGVEMVCENEVAEALFMGLLEAGASEGIKPCGLGARDTLRLEAGLPLNGNDLSPKRTPIQAGLKIFVSFREGKSFPGRSVMEKQVAEGASEMLAAFVLPEGPPPRAHYKVFDKEGVKELGEACSGAPSPTLGYGIGFTYLSKEYTAVGTELMLDVRGRMIPIQIVKKPFYRRPAANKN